MLPSLVFKLPRSSIYQHASIDPDNEVEPRLNREVGVCVAQDLEARGIVYARGPFGLLGLCVEGADEAIESVEHDFGGG